MKNGIYILSAGLHSGKTTALNKWANERNDVSGFLSPKIDGKIHFTNVKTGENRLLEVEASAIQIGQFHFDESVFQWAVENISSQLKTAGEWLIIDEVGPLEVKFDQGFHQTILEILHLNCANKKIIFVVRDFLVQNFVDKYEIKDAQILPLHYFNNEDLTPLSGIVLAGGKSTRMGTDKALLQYYDKEQWKYAASLLNYFAEDVFISINKEQDKNWAKDQQSNFIIDEEQFGNKGPISGILSVYKKQSHSGFLVLGIDYPLLKLENLIQLNNYRSEKNEAICFLQNGFLEPLCTIYEKSAVEKMKTYFENGGESLSQFLKEINTKVLALKDESFLKNVNSQKEHLEIMELNKKNL